MLTHELPCTARRYLPFAVVHFIGSGSVNRALRHWARTSSVATRLARECHPDADGFKLSDYGLVPIKRRCGSCCAGQASMRAFG